MSPTEPQSPVDSLQRFALPQDFELQLVAAEPEVLNPTTLAVDERGRLYVAQSYNYLAGPEQTPLKPSMCPIVLLEPDEAGGLHCTRTVADNLGGIAMGMTVRGGRIWLAVTGRVLTAELSPDGSAGDWRTIVRDTGDAGDAAWFYRLRFGPDGWLYMTTGEFQARLGGSDGRVVVPHSAAGCLVRFRPDGSDLEVVAQGLVDPVEFDFDAYGRIWLAGSSMNMPSYLTLVIPSADYQSLVRRENFDWHTGKHPWSPPVHEVAQGYRLLVTSWYDEGFPADYWGGLLVTTWPRPEQHLAPVSARVDLVQPDERGRIASALPLLEGFDPRFHPSQIVPSPDGQAYLLDLYSQADREPPSGRIYKIVYRGADTPKPLVKEVFEAKTSLSAEMSAALLAIQDRSASSRERAMQTLIRGGDAVVPAVLQVLRQDHQPFISSQLLWVLYGIGTPAAAEAVAETLQTKHHLVRAEAVRILRRLKPANLETLVASMAEDPDPETRIEWALCAADDATVVHRLMQALFEPTVNAQADRRLRYQAAMELSRRMSSEQFREMLTSKEAAGSQVGWMALDMALLEGMNPAGREVYRDLLTHPEAATVSGVIDLAEAWLDDEFLPLAEKLLQNPKLPPNQRLPLSLRLTLCRDKKMRVSRPDIIE